MAELTDRARQILYTAITEYVATGEPVGSRTLSKKGIGLSPASIRNVLADLEEMGYLRQPHTSAGRVPTERALRLFIDAMMDVRSISEAEQAQIHLRLAELEPGPGLLRETGRLLSELTGTAAVVVAPRAESQALRTLRFIRTVPGELLAVLVMSDGTVHNRFLKAHIEEAELQKVHNVLDGRVEGRTLGQLRDLLAQGARQMTDTIEQRAFSLGEAAVTEPSEGSTEVLIEGRAKLLGLPEFADAEGMKGALSALDEPNGLVKLLDATLAANGTTVVVGREAGDVGGGLLAIVGAAYGAQGRVSGSVGVIGPTRMDYPKVVPLVAATAVAVSQVMERGRGGGTDGAPPSEE
ncbi:MAG: heat-inducible transcription repressor HrcA [Myxococcales bacterium]|nr:heat-inducible transcription repressor HrcA [Myxococcales bacterium]